MFAAARCATETPAPEPPQALWLAWQCHRWGSLPEAGGLLDQPAGLLQRMSVAENVYNAFVALGRVPAGTVAKWVDENPQTWAIIDEVETLWMKLHGSDI